jgi:hypothetical protein
MKVLPSHTARRPSNFSLTHLKRRKRKEKEKRKKKTINQGTFREFKEILWNIKRILGSI